jgi:hypothetical protein
VITTWVHHLADALAKGNLWHFSANTKHRDEVREDCAEIAELLPRLPVFVFQQNGRDLENDALFDHAHETWTGLPFKDMVLETPIYLRDDQDDPDRYVILAHQSDDGRVVIELFGTSDDPTVWWCDFGIVVLTPENGELYCEHREPPDVPLKHRNQIQASMQDALGMLVGFIGLLNTPAIASEKRPASEKLNRARAKRGRAAIPNYTTVTLRLPKRKPGERESAGQSGRASPRVHWRSGHKREYRPGKWSVVPPTIVGHKSETEAPPPPRYNVTMKPGRTQS